MKQFGPEVNLGNIPPEEVIPLETLRLGLRGDTLREILLAESPHPPPSRTCDHLRLIPDAHASPGVGAGSWPGVSAGSSRSRATRVSDARREGSAVGMTFWQTARRGRVALRKPRSSSAKMLARAVRLTSDARARSPALHAHSSRLETVRWLTWDEVRARRLARSHLVERAPAESLVEVVREVGGIHAQVMGSAELQLAARVEGITQVDVREALWERRKLAKTWTLRGTLHLHPADELRLWTAARRAVVGDRLRRGASRTSTRSSMRSARRSRGERLLREDSRTPSPASWVRRRARSSPPGGASSSATRRSPTSSASGRRRGKR